VRAEHDVTVAARPVAVVTRPQPQADEWVQRLQALGQPAQALPLMRIEPLAADAPDLQAAWAALASQSLVMFVSPNAVLRFFAAAPAGAHWPAATRAGATGPGTQAALLEQGVPAELVDAPRADAARFDAETLWTQVLQRRDWSGRAVLIVRGEDGRDWLADTLRQAGAHVSALAAYRRLPPAWSAGECAQLARLLPAALAPGAAPDTVWLFSSSQCVDHLMAQLDQGDPALRERALQRPALGTHPRIAQTARQAGFACVQAVPPDAVVIVDALRSLAARPATP